MSLQRNAIAAAWWLVTILVVYVLIMAVLVWCARRQSVPDQGSEIFGGCVFFVWAFIAVVGAALEMCRKDSR